MFRPHGSAGVELAAANVYHEEGAHVQERLIRVLRRCCFCKGMALCRCSWSSCDCRAHLLAAARVDAVRIGTATIVRKKNMIAIERQLYHTVHTGAAR
jgi:hypothetical protein